MKGGSGPQQLQIWAYNTNMEIHMHQCRTKLAVTGIDSHYYCLDIN